MVLVTYWDLCKGVSRVLGSTHQIGLSHTESRESKGDIVITEQVQLGIGVRVQL